MSEANRDKKIFLGRMGELSIRLQEILAAAGIKRGDGILLVSRLAHNQKLRDWPDTRNESDYDALISAVKDHVLKQAAKLHAPERSEGSVLETP